MDNLTTLTDTPITFWNRLPAIDRQIIRALSACPGLTCKKLSDAIGLQDEAYGKFMAPARRLVFLRAWGIVTDVESRCEHCHSALSRGQRNVPLYLTASGRDLFAAVIANDRTSQSVAA